jgi:streptogramin lyase
MREKTIEEYLTWAVERIGGVTFKFRSPSQRGVADRIVCLPNGETWFIELKTDSGRLSPLQKVFASVMQQTNQKYKVLWSTEQVDAFVASVSRTRS